LPLRPFDVPVNVLDSTKLINETGWNAMVSFEEGIKRTNEHGTGVKQNIESAFYK